MKEIYKFIGSATDLELTDKRNALVALRETLQDPDTRRDASRLIHAIEQEMLDRETVLRVVNR